MNSNFLIVHGLNCEGVTNSLKAHDAEKRTCAFSV